MPTAFYYGRSKNPRKARPTSHCRTAHPSSPVNECDANRALKREREWETTPPIEVALSQRTLDETLGALKIRRAIVVPTSKLAYLARLAFGEGDYRVFYNDISAAINWLGKESAS